ncbi:MAG: GNAT family N-acetyltransferase [Bacteriovoracaceae bacterium]
MSEIVNLTKISAKDLTELKEIFFESSTKKIFKDEAEKEAFYEKYLGHYLTHFPEYVWVAREGRILGYMIAAPVTKNPGLYAIQPHLVTFEEYFQDYPAHLHVNFHADARGKGLGSKLFSELEKQLQRLKIRGVHIMTGPDSRNKSFYQRLGFDFEVTLNFQGSPILMMGKKL